ncbi:MAG: aminotransferase class I/II-fold pyridoxal phosphate-dependent enzyme [Deltaproteobacteria bacterium]|nr:aminotransferase class I/II-fold pyridoxal phosphate-dependent enzyme [Deltaproteobacteria bacterium]
MRAKVSADRIDGVGTSIFTEITALAVRHGAVNLGQGFPDFAAPAFVKEAAARHIREDHNQYAASPGVPRLRQALADDWRRRHPDVATAIDPANEITVGAGATELLHDAILGTVNPRDEVIVFDPAYDAYRPDIAVAGGVARTVRLHAPDWTFDPAALSAAFGPRTRALILNTPHNPTGKMFSRTELETIAALCQRHDVTVISDEVYSEITFGAVHVSIATLPGMFDRTITIDSMGKTFSVTGWKVGWAIAPAALTAALRAVHQFVTFTNATPFQEALADVLPMAVSTGYYDQLRADYQRRRDLLSRVLRGAGLEPMPIGGAYFLLTDVTSTGFANDADFCRRLVTEYGVAAIPTSVFYEDPRTAPPLARFCFAKQDGTILSAADRLAALATRRIE